MRTFPGPQLMHGDAVRLTTDTTSRTITGDNTSQGVLRDGRGFVELVLPDAGPEQRRDLERTQRYQCELYHSGALLYSSPQLTLSGTRREQDEALVMAGSP
ncbi:hypothetical protein ACFYNN_34435 [Streptomyces sp. NPDC006978]|uniref:hypothetical protein n=1 Tax=unclassified Streptomyces TaxID=2593676 RepID=UPI0036C53494